MNLECNEVLKHFWLSHSCISTLLTLKSALFSPIFIFKMIFSRASSSLGSLAKASLPSKIMPFLCYLSFSSSFLVWGFFFPAWFFCFSFRFCWGSQHFGESLPITDGCGRNQYVGQCVMFPAWPGADGVSRHFALACHELLMVSVHVTVTMLFKPVLSFVFIFCVLQGWISSISYLLRGCQICNI